MSKFEFPVYIPIYTVSLSTYLIFKKGAVPWPESFSFTAVYKIYKQVYKTGIPSVCETHFLLASFKWQPVSLRNNVTPVGTLLNQI